MIPRFERAARALLSLLLALLVTTLALPARSGIQDSRAGHHGWVEIAHDLAVERVAFGEFSYDETTHQVRFEPATRLAMLPGRTYGWRVHLHTTRKDVTWQERLTLPSAPRQWGVTEHVSLSPDRRTATTTLPHAPITDGVVDNYWVFSEGDPLGRYEIEVAIEGVRVGRSTLTVY